MALARKFLRSHLAVLGIKPEFESAQAHGASDNKAEEANGSQQDNILDLEAKHSSCTARLNYALDRRFFGTAQQESIAAVLACFSSMALLAEHGGRSGSSSTRKAETEQIYRYDGIC